MKGVYVWRKALASDLSLPASSNPSSNVQSRHVDCRSYVCASSVTSHIFLSHLIFFIISMPQHFHVARCQVVQPQPNQFYFSLAPCIHQHEIPRCRSSSLHPRPFGHRNWQTPDVGIGICLCSRRIFGITVHPLLQLFHVLHVPLLNR